MWRWALKTSPLTNKPSLWIASDFGPEWAGTPLDMSFSPTSPEVLYQSIPEDIFPLSWSP